MNKKYLVKKQNFHKCGNYEKSNYLRYKFVGTKGNIILIISNEKDNFETHTQQKIAK